MNLLNSSVSTDFWIGVIFAIIGFELITFVILLIISYNKSFKRMQELYQKDLEQQRVDFEDLQTISKSEDTTFLK